MDCQSWWDGLSKEERKKIAKELLRLNPNMKEFGLTKFNDLSRDQQIMVYEFWKSKF